MLQGAMAGCHQVTRSSWSKMLRRGLVQRPANTGCKWAPFAQN